MKKSSLVIRGSGRTIGSAVVALCALSASLASPLVPGQRGDHGGGGGHPAGNPGGGGGSRGGGQSRPAPVAHAAREVVRSSTFIPRSAPNQGGASRTQASQNFRNSNTNGQRPSGGSAFVPSRIGTGSKPSFDHRPVASTNRTFTRTTAGRRYDNGVILHHGIKVTAGWQRNYFPGGSYHYPYYTDHYRSGVYFSPFGFYFGICDPYILSTGCSYYPPAVTFIDEPIYNGQVFSGWDQTDNNAFDQADLNAMEPGLLNATDEISEAFQNNNIDAMVSLVDPNVSIAIYTQGKYQYSMSADNYLDLTRDTLKAVKTVALSLNYLREDSPTVYTLSGKQVYQAPNGQQRAVYLSFVLQDISGQWTLTQVGTSPDRIQSFR